MSARSLPMLFICWTALANAQNDRLAELNAAFGGRVRISILKDDLLAVDLFDGETPVRQDLAYIELLDSNSVAYVEEEAAMVVKCRADEQGCVVKEVFKSGKVVPTNRMIMPIAISGADREALLVAFRTLIADEQRRIADQDRETNVRPRRKN